MWLKKENKSNLGNNYQNFCEFLIKEVKKYG